jgi:hypothetical protein
MNSLISFIKRHPQITFWGIAYVTFFVAYYLYVLYPSDLWEFAIWGVFLGGALVTGTQMAIRYGPVRGKGRGVVREMAKVKVRAVVTDINGGDEN